MPGMILTLGAACLTLLLFPGGAAAQWEGWFEWGTQGSYVHQMAHLLFMAAMLFFIREMHRGDLLHLPGFRSMVWACWLLAWWNLDAVLGHAIEWSLYNPVIMGRGLNQWLVMDSLQVWLFYITKLTHFLLPIPAFLLFCLSLKAMAGSIEALKP